LVENKKLKTAIMKKYIYVLVFPLIAVFIMSANTVHASMWDQGVYNADITLSGNVGWHPNLSSASSISSITLVARDMNNPATCSHTDSMYLITSNDGTTITSNTGFTLESAAAGYQVYTANYSPPIAGSALYSIVINGAPANPGGSGCDGYVPSFQIEGATGLSDPYTPNFFGGSGYTSYAPTVYFNGVPSYIPGVSPPYGTPTISFENPPFSPGVSTPDFHDWWLTENIPANHDPAITGYYFGVSYGTSSPTGSSDSLLNAIGILPLGATDSVSDSPLLSKEASSTPGNYQAQAFLYNQSGTVIASSTVLNFTITGNGSTIVTVPNNNASPNSPPLTGCSATSFNIFGADIGKGICDAATYLFVPPQSALNAFASLQTKIASSAPFSYFYNVQSDLTGISVTSSTMAALTLNTGSSTPIHISFDIFSPTTLDRFTDSNSRGLLRTLIQWGLYLAFITMVVFEVKHLFNK
jgi:hypothetical protein